MGLSFLPEEILKAVSHLNYNFITEIRIRRGQPVIIGYRGEYYYLERFGLGRSADRAVCCNDLSPLIMSATGGSLYSYSEQMKKGFITCGHGIRIGLAGEYITQGGEVTAVSGITSVNIRIPHTAEGCASDICTALLKDGLHSILLFSKPGLGKTTRLRDIIRYINGKFFVNVLVFDERNEISAMDGGGNGYNLGERVDVVRAGNKLKAFENAIRAMRPDVIVTDELYGEEDERAVKYAADCGIYVVASSHLIDKAMLKRLPFEYFVHLESLFGQPLIYDKDFNPCGGGGTDDFGGSVSVGK